MRLCDWSLVFVAIVAGFMGAGNVAGKDEAAASPSTAASTVVYLGKSPDFYVPTRGGGDHGLLVREFFRQALLLAARDELGLVTRDAWLGDAIPDAAPALPWELAVHREVAPPLQVLRGVFGATRTLGAAELPPYSQDAYDKQLFVAAERLSRTTFVEILKTQYGLGKPHAWKPSVAVPRAVEDSLREMSFLAQFKAVRQVHDLMAAQGESPAILGALVRGYANLGVLTEFHWHPAHKVFKARAILYAQRWLAREPESVPALWHRAYALTLTGLHVDATADLESAQKAWQVKGEKERPPRPGWVGLLDACCRYDVDKFAAELEHAEHGQLATLLRYHTVELAGNQRWAWQTGVATLKLLPECYRIYHGVYQFGGALTWDRVTRDAHEILERTLYDRVRAMPGIPESVRREAVRPAKSGLTAFLPWSLGDRSGGRPEDFAARARLIAALRKAGQRPLDAIPERTTAAASDTKVEGRSQAKPVANPAPKNEPEPSDIGEPSWEALAQLIQEVSFVHVWRRAEFVRQMFGSSVDEFMKSAQPLVADHPLRLFLEGFSWDMEKRNEAIDQAAWLTPEGLEADALCVLNNMRYWHVVPGSTMYQDMYLHSDDLARDFVVICRIFASQPERLGRYAKTLLEISPNSPLARAFLVDAGAAKEPQIAEWEKLAPKYPALANSLARYHAAAERPDEALRLAQMAIKIVEDPALYEFIADQYLCKCDKDRCLKALEKALELPDTRLGYFGIHERLASRWIEKKEWKRALPYAEAAAQMRTGSALGCMAKVYEGLQEWGKAERYWQEAAERHKSWSMVWYYFCRRTGKGDLEAARALAKSYIDTLPARNREDSRFDAAIFHLLEKQPEKALAIYASCFAKEPDVFFGLWVAILSDELKDFKSRDAAFERIRTVSPALVPRGFDKPRTELIQLAAWIERDLAQGGKGQIDLDAVEKLLEPVKMYYEAKYARVFLARYLQSHGKREEAIRCWKQNIPSPDLPDFSRDFAGAALNDLGVRLEDYQELLSGPARTEAKPATAADQKSNKDPPKKSGDKSVKEAPPAAKDPAKARK